MRRMMVIVFLAALISGVAVPAANAAAQEKEPTYQLGTETTVRGTVTRLFTKTGQRGTARQRATLKQADDSTIDIHIGPTSYVVAKKMILKVGDQVTVTGSRVVEGGAPLVVVRRLTRDTQVLDMRGADGKRLWRDRYR
jgi:hypothetical protein